MKRMVNSFAFAVSIWLCFDETDGAGFEKVPSCPFANEWQRRQRTFQCETQDKVYVCLMDDSMDFREGCIFEETIHSGTTGCPSITVRNGEPLLSLPESFHKCPVENPDCPLYDHEEYKLSEIYKYPACIYKTDLPASTISTGSISTSTVRATKSTEFTYPNCTCINPVEEDDDLIKDAVIWSFVPIYVVSIIIVTVAILRYRRKFNRNNSENENIELDDPTSCKKYMFENGENYERNHDDLAPFGNNSENENIEFDDPTSCKYDMFENGENYERNHDDLAPFVVTPESSSWLSLSPPKMKKNCQDIFDKLDGFLSAGKFTDFWKYISNISGFDDIDLQCSISYLKIHGFQHQGKYQKARDEFETGIKLCYQTSNPTYYGVKLLTAKARIFVKTEEHTNLENILHDIFSKIDPNRTLFKGEVAAWSFFDRSRCNRNKLRFLNCENDELEKQLDEAVKDMKQAVQRFNDCNNLDGERYMGVSKLELIALQLRWNINSMDPRQRMNPSSDVMIECKTLLDSIEYSDIPMDFEIKVQFLKAKSIYCFRAGIDVRTKECLNKLSKLIDTHKRNGLLEILQTMRDVMLPGE